MEEHMLDRLGTLVFTLALTAMMLLPAPDAHACSCFPPDLTQQLNTADNVFRARIRGNGIVWKNYRWYRARVQRVYQGCLERGDRVLLRTSASSAACGMQLQKNTTYLVTGGDGGAFYGTSMVTFGSCGFTKAWSSVTQEQTTLLNGQYNCCEGKCGCADGSMPVQCFADPCAMSSCPHGTCTANYCGGCHAEYTLDSGYGVCSPCEANEDCPWNQNCGNGGQCMPGCQEDDDCGDDHWCRLTDAMDESMVCVPYAQEGESCGGYTPIWAVSKCSPEQTCTDVPQLVMDAPGTCRLPCTDDDGCAANQYCGSGDVCREDASCWAAGDCAAAGNAWDAVACEGYATCGQWTNACEWHCGSGPTCEDLSEVIFGWCDMVLGAGVVGDTCQMISGCEDQGYPLFDDVPACYETCLPGLIPK